MSEIVDTLIDGLLDREADTGSTATWGGQTVPCSGGGAREGKMLDIGGFRPNASVVIVIRMAALDTTGGRPSTKQTVTYVSDPTATGKVLLIDNVTLLYNQILVLECRDPNQGS